MSNYRIEQNGRLSGMFRVLGNPHRLRIFMQLAQCCCGTVSCSLDETEHAQCVSDIASGLDLAPSTVSHHLKEMRMAGLIERSRQGKTIYCSLSPEALEMIHAFSHWLASETSALSGSKA